MSKTQSETQSKSTNEALWIKLAAGAEVGAAIPWARLDSNGHVLARGVDPIESLPSGLPCHAVLAAERVLFTVATLPIGKTFGKKLSGQTLAFAVEDLLADDPENVHVVAGRADARGQTPLVIVDRAWFSSVLLALKTAGSTPITPMSVGVEAESLALSEDEWVLAWTEQPFVRGIGASALPLSPDADGALAMLALALGQAVRRPAQLVLHADAIRALPDMASWSATLGLPVAAEATYDWAQSAWALKGGIDLLQGDFSQGPRLRVDGAAWRPVAYLALALLLINGIGLLGGDGMKALEAKRLAGGNEAVFRAAFPEAKVVVDPVLQMRRQVEALRHAGGQSSATDFLPMLALAGEGVSPRVRQEVTEMRYEAGRLTLGLPVAVLGESEQVARWAQAGFSSNRKTAPAGGVELTLEAKP